MKRLSIAALAVAAALSGCATTDAPETNAAAPSPEARSGQPATSSSTGTAKSGQVGSRSTGTSARPGGQGDLKRSVYFEYDKYDVKPEYRALVEEHARWLKANPKAKLVVEGNADERGSREYNVALGQRRAEAVTKMLVLMGAKPEQIEAVSWGEEKPRSTGHDEASWSENRRDDFVRR